MFKRFTWLTCAVLLCALLISLPAGQVAVASEPAVARIGDKGNTAQKSKRNTARHDIIKTWINR